MANRNSGGGRLLSGALYRTVSGLAIGLALAGAAQAQNQAGTANDGTLDEIVVTGIRAGIQGSINIKKNETSIVEAVSAEDIGKLPDVSIAESIARLPGLAAQRVNGRAQVISIRGLSPDFTTTLLNGRQQASSGDNRAVEFDQYPSELLSSVVIYKTPDAQIAGQGLSGTADLRTVRPLEFGKRAASINIRGEKTSGSRLNDDVRNYGGRVSASYIDQLADGKLGIAIGYAHLDSPSQIKHYKAYGYEAFPNPAGAISPASAANALLLNGQEAWATSRSNNRDAAIGIFELKPNDTFHSTLDLYYSKFNQEETTRGAQWFSNPFADGATFTNVQTSTVGGSPFITSGTQNRAVPILRNDFNTRQDELFSAGWNNEFDLGEGTLLTADLSYSRNHRREQILESYAGYGRGVGFVSGATPDAGRTFDTIGFQVNDNGFSQYNPGLNYADASQVSLGDRAPWSGWGHDGAVRYPNVTEEVYALDGRAEHEYDSFITKVTVGVNYTHRDKTRTVSDNDLFLKNNRQQTLVDAGDLVDPTSLGFVGFGDVLSVKIGDVFPKYYNVVPILDSNNFDKAWDITEKVTTFYARANYEFGNLTGNFGVQVERQDQSSNGTIINTTGGNGVVPSPTVGGATYTDVLPSLNATYDLGSGHRIRFALSKTLARPRIDDLRANVTPSFNSTICSGQTCAPGSTVNPWSARGGNPNLKPWRANAVDLAYEWYIAPTTYLSVAGYYKDLKTYIYNRTIPFDFTGLPLPTTASSIPSNVTISPLGQITAPDNGKGGSLKGLEFSGALDFGVLWEALDGLGVQGSLSFTDSKLNPTDSTNPAAAVRIPGLSKTVYNITGYYEREGFQFRISQRYRSAFKGEVVQLFATRGFTEILSDKQVDAQIGYTFQEGQFENLGFLLQVNNLTDSPYRTRLGLDGGGTKTSDGGSLPETYEKYGRQFLFGVNYRF